MNHAERQRLKDFERGKRMLWKLGLSWRQLNDEDKWWRLGLYKKHEKNWHIIMRKIYKELDDEAEELRSTSEAERGGEAQG